MLPAPVQDFSIRGGSESGRARKRAAIARQQSVLALYIAGMSKIEIARKLGVSWRTIHNDLIALDDARVRTEDVLEDAGVDATDAHIRLSQMFDADIADIIDENTGSYKPIHQWPKIWRQMLTGAEIKELFELSKDSAGKNSTEKIGEIVKLRYVDQLKVIELLLRHKDVDGLAQSAADSKVRDLTINVVYANRHQGSAPSPEPGRVIEVTPEVEK